MDKLREYLENYPAYLSSREGYAAGYKDGVCRAKEIALELLNEAELRQVANINICRVYKEDGVQMIKFLGYFYKNDEGWVLVEFGFFDLTLGEYWRNQYRMDELECDAKQYVTNFNSVNDAYSALKSYGITDISGELSQDTPEGVYLL